MLTFGLFHSKVIYYFDAWYFKRVLHLINVFLWIVFVIVSGNNFTKILHQDNLYLNETYFWKTDLIKIYFLIKNSIYHHLLFILSKIILENMYLNHYCLKKIIWCKLNFRFQFEQLLFLEKLYNSLNDFFFQFAVNEIMEFSRFPMIGKFQFMHICLKLNLYRLKWLENVKQK